MNSRELLKAIGGIDDKFIEEAAQAAPAVKRPLKRTFARAGIAAACLALVLGLGIYTKPFGGSRTKNGLASNSTNTSYNISSDDGLSTEGAALPEQDKVQHSGSRPIQHIEYELLGGAVTVDNAADPLNSFYPPGGFDIPIPSSKDMTRALWLFTIEK